MIIHSMATINYFDSVQIQLSTLMAKAFIYIYVLRAMSHTSYAAQVGGFIFQPAKFDQTITDQHLLTLSSAFIKSRYPVLLPGYGSVWYRQKK